MKGSKQILLIMGIISLIVLFIFTLFIMAQYAKHYEQKSDSSNAHTLNSSSAIIEQHTMSNLASLDLYLLFVTLLLVVIFIPFIS